MKGHVLLGIFQGWKGVQLSLSSLSSIHSLGLLVWCEHYVNHPLAAWLAHINEIFHLARSSACTVLARASLLPWGAICFPCTCGVELFFSPFILLSKQTLTSNTCILFTLQPEPKGKEAGLPGGWGGGAWEWWGFSLLLLFISREATGRFHRDSCQSSVDNDAYCLLIDTYIVVNTHWQAVH